MAVLSNRQKLKALKHYSFGEDNCLVMNLDKGRLFWDFWLVNGLFMQFEQLSRLVFYQLQIVQLVSIFNVSKDHIFLS